MDGRKGLRSLPDGATCVHVHRYLGHDPVDLLRVDGGGEGAVLGAGDDEGGEPHGPDEAGEVEVEPVVLEGEMHFLWRKTKNYFSKFTITSCIVN